MIAAAEKSLDELTLGESVTLEDLVDRPALGEMAQSFFDLFRIPIKLFSESGAILADAGEQQTLYAYLNTLKHGRIALHDVVSTIKSINPGRDGEVSHPCVTGAAYRIVAISYDGRRIGRMILGPFLPHGITEPPRSLIEIDPDVDPARARSLLFEIPRARDDTVAHIARHLKRTLDLILFSGHKALLTTNMHLAAVRESYRELQEKNAKLQQAYDRLKELDRLKSNFLATVSHELRTPLTSIIGYSEMLFEGIAGDMTAEQREFVRTIHEKGEQLLELIKGLLDLSKLESGTMSMRKKNVDAGPLIEDVASTLQPTARKKGVELSTDVDGPLPALWADPERVRQVLLNLAENAIKFTPAGGRVTLQGRTTMMDAPQDQEGAGLVLLGARRTAVELRVADTGIGIPPGERERVFDAFYQVDSSSTREQGGTGLGLSIVKRLAEAHDGTVRIEDNAPRGTVFVVTLPCRRATIA
jgi:two-component system, NarL family, sensor histidine kinase BarA